MGNTLCFSTQAARIAARLVAHEFANCPHGVVVAARLRRMIDEGYFRDDPPPPVLTHRAPKLDPLMPPAPNGKRNGGGRKKNGAATA